MRVMPPTRRRRAERLMTAECVVRRPTGEMVTDPETFELIPEYTVVYQGRCKPQTYDPHEMAREVAGGTQIVQRSNVHFPVGAFRSKTGDVITVTDSTDPLLVGRSYQIVQEVPVKEHATAYRVFVDENLGEEVPPWP